MRPVRGSTHATPGSLGGASPPMSARTQRPDEPGNRARKISGKRRTIARFAALSTSSQHEATLKLADGFETSTAATLRLVDRAPAPRSINRFQISIKIRTSWRSSRMATSMTPGAAEAPLGNSKNTRRPERAARPRTISCAARCPASAGSGAIERSREKATASGRPIAMPSRIQFLSVADVPRPRSSSPTRDRRNPTCSPSSA